MAAGPDEPGASSGQRLRTPNDWTGREVAGRYGILERLGEGGMGVVYVAEHLHLKKRVAFKVIHPDLAAHEELLLRFKREALATGQLDHPHIAAAIDFGELEDGGAFMVMPLVRGGSLQVELDAHGKFEPRRAARVGAQIADALSAAHAVGIIHRDLKPDNVLLEQRGDGSEAAKVLDFGVASLAGRPGELSVDARPLTQAGTILGTPGYMSPEQATAGEVDHRTDLYALGVILWELCRGERLFDGEDITQIFAKQFKSLPAALELGREGPERALSALVARLLAWNKNERPSSAAEVRDELRRIAEAPASRLPELSLPDLPALREKVQALSPYRKQIAAAFGALVLVLVFALRDGADEANVAPEPHASNAPPPSPQVAPPQRAQPETPARESNGTAKRDKPAARDNATLESARETLLRGRNRESRRQMAKRVVRNDEGMPRYLQLVAELELSDRCSDKKGVLAEMRALFDPRVLPALERLAEQPRRGCGLLKLSDCLACLRRELDQTIGALQHVGGS